MEDNDKKALTEEQQAWLNKAKIRTRIENERYLRDHPEVNILISGFIREVLLKRPENIPEFSAEYFTRPDLPEKVEEKKHEETKQYKARKESNYF